MGIYVRQKRNGLYLDIYVNGKRTWQSLHLTIGKDKQINKENWKLAEMARTKKEQQLMASEWDIVDPLAGRQTLVEYSKGLAVSKKSPSMEKANVHLAAFAGEVKLGAINEPWLERYKAWLLTRGLSPKTSRRYFAEVKHVLRCAEAARLISHDPGRSVDAPHAPDVRKVFLNPDEITRLAAAPLETASGYEISRAWLFSAHVGLRVSDLRSLTWGDIERSPRPSITKTQVKTGDTVAIPLSASAWALINDEALHLHDERVFSLLTASNSSATKYFRAWAKQAGVTKIFGWHSARHSFAINSIEAGTDIFTLSGLLGHADVKTTQIYAKVSSSRKREAVDSLAPVGMKARKA